MSRGTPPQNRPRKTGGSALLLFLFAWNHHHHYHGIPHPESLYAPTRSRLAENGGGHCRFGGAGIHLVEMVDRATK
jgi:hypothetical protein